MSGRAIGGDTSVREGRTNGRKSKRLTLAQAIRMESWRFEAGTVGVPSYMKGRIGTNNVYHLDRDYSTTEIQSALDAANRRLIMFTILHVHTNGTGPRYSVIHLQKFKRDWKRIAQDWLKKHPWLKVRLFR